MRIVLALMISVFMAAAGVAQQDQPSPDKSAEKAKPAAKEKRLAPEGNKPLKEDRVRS